LSYLIIFIPWLIVFIVSTVGLVGYNIVISFTDWYGIFPSFNFVGFKNYIQLFSMSGFIKTLKNTALLFGLGLPVAVGLSIVLAILMDIIHSKVAAFFRTTVIMSMALGGVMVAVFWGWMYNYRYGGINSLLRYIGLDFLAFDWLGSSRFVMFAAIIMLIWKFVGYGGLIVLGGLQGVSQSNIESAQLEGATTEQIYLYVLLPQVKGQIMTITLILSMYFLKSFDFIWPLTGGGPGWASTVFPVLVYRQMFQANNYAGGAAAATFMFIIASTIAIPYIMLSKRD
jgi:glucose/mannose transport system permease protein